MPTNRVTGNAKDGIVVLRVARDKEYDKVQIAERFEVPYIEITDATPMHIRMAYAAMVEVKMRETVKHAAATYERLRHWKWDSSMPVTLDISDSQYDLDEFRSSRFDADFKAVDQGSIIDKKGLVAYVAKMWFIQPKIEVEVIEPEPDDPEVQDGMVNPHYMPQFVSLESGEDNG